MGPGITVETPGARPFPVTIPRPHGAVPAGEASGILEVAGGRIEGPIGADVRLAVAVNPLAVAWDHDRAGTVGACCDHGLRVAGRVSCDADGRHAGAAALNREVHLNSRKRVPALIGNDEDQRLGERLANGRCLDRLRLPD